MRADSVFFATLALVAGLAMAADQPDSAAPAVEAEMDAYLAIDWHDGTVEEAFAEAERSAKPLFLYWGAIWCPPCNLMKSTLFQQPEFIASTRDFVAVHLDGDTERAQVWGEKHDAVGYPTLIVFDSQGNQLTRLPGTLAAESFMAALDDARSDLAPVAEIVQVALNSDRPLTDAEHRRLAYHSWYQDKRTLAPEQYLALFERLAAQAPQDDPVLARRAHSLRLSEAAGSGEAALDAERYSELMFVLDAEEHDLDNLMMFSGKLAAVFDALAADCAQQEELRQAFSGAIEAVLASPAGNKSAPIFSLGMLLELERLDHAEAPPSPRLLERIVAAARQADSAAESQQERQSLIYYTYSLLSKAGEYKRARILLEKELEISEEPYYFMYPLATLSHKTGDTEGAVRWMERYYRESYGPATRLQHGVNYARRMMLWTPGEVETILSVSQEALAEMHGQPDALANRNLRSLGWLVDALEAWRTEHHAGLSLAALDSGIATICAEHAAERPASACLAMQQRLSAPAPGI
ncbi:MAG: thioredoxin family protein [Gammaproteobacteria bacterium]|nr:thioredoxin family protein [Gammaproteobacteria bacterium]